MIIESLVIGPGSKKTLGKQITTMRIKGQQVARVRVIPANPNTAGQQTQRGYLRTVVEEFHTIGLSADDLAAYNRWATASFRKLSGFNLFTREKVNYYISGGLASFDVTDVAVSAVLSTSASVDFNLDSDGTCKIYYGTSKTSQLTSDDCTDEEDDTFTYDFAGLAPSTTYYFYLLYSDSGGKTARTGLYTFTTAAA